MLFGGMNNPMIDVVEEIATMAELGFEFLDLTLEPDQTYSATLDVNAVAKALTDAEMGVVGHTAWYLPIASPFPEMREAAIRELERCMRVFSDLGADKMNVHPQTKVPLHEEDWVIAQNIDALARLADLGKQLKVTVMMENMPNFSRVAQLKPIFEAVPEIELLLDIGHANLDTSRNHAEELLAHFGERLGHVHVHDNRGGKDDMHLPLGVGNIKWLKIVRALKNANYDGTVTIEVFGDDDDYLVMSRDKLKYLWERTEPGEKSSGSMPH
ncbi:MAG: sugar phosphate isomerase/epimerase family protein [Armatimonadota bacterium]|nr:sugar phosphate isomerase/epimerase [bacterium]